ncbi:MAG: serine hydrolase domain-containing protein [Xanthobacteraceae bacterium]
MVSLVRIVTSLATALAAMSVGSSVAQPIDPIQHSLEIVLPGASGGQRFDLAAAMRTLHVGAVDIALIERGRIAWSRHFGKAETNTIYQAASLSKLVTAVAALRLVERGALDLDRNVNDDLIEWRIPDSDLTRGHPVTLRGLLSMTAGIGVPGYLGYAPGEPLPNLTQILDGTPPANSQPVRVEAIPGSRYAYSGGGYEIVQALIEAKTKQRFQDAIKTLLFGPVGMTNSLFLQPLPADLAARAAKGHRNNGEELPGGWRVVPELAAGGLWSSANDLAALLVALARSYRGKPDAVLSAPMAHLMMQRQNDGPYGLGGAVAGSGGGLVLMKRGQNIGYQSYMLLFPETGQGIAILSNSDNGTILATALIRRAAEIYHWPAIGLLAD